MLAFRVGKGDSRMADVPKDLRKQAANRKGSWRITVYERPPHICENGFAEFMRYLRGKQVNEYAVVYTEEEYAKIARTIYHGMRNGTKTTSFQASLENVAQVLWPKGSVDHVAMRHVGVAAVLSYVSRHETELGPCCCRWAACAYNGVAAKLERISGTGPPCDPTTVDEQPGTPPGGSNGVNRNEGGEDGARPPTVLETPSTPEDDANAASASADGRTMVNGDVVAVLGQDYGTNGETNHVPVVGLMVGPCQVKPNVYSKTAHNVKAAVEERIDKKKVDFSLNDADKQRIGRLVRKSMSDHKACGVFGKERIRQWAIDNLDLESLKSGKWSTQRFKASLENLYSSDEPRYGFKAGIKYECMPEGKAPRLLIADGDDGQLMALAVVKCFEDLLFHHFESKSIKHLAKREAVDRVLKELTKKGAGTVEGDGSAWDTTCNVAIRGLVENPVLRHIMTHLAEFGVLPESWAEEHQKACEAKKLRLFFKNKFETLTVTIDAIRRSGHRGTSCLNWWINFVMWVSAVFREPERFLDVTTRYGVDLAGVRRWWNGCFEGDDSLCSLFPPMKAGDALSQIFLAFWKGGGFNMKIVFCDKRATFVGWHLGCTSGELNQFRSPELPRALANSGVSVSTGAIEAAKKGCRQTAEELAAASALARAADFAGIQPSVSGKYLGFAEGLLKEKKGSWQLKDREMSFRAYGEDGHSAQEVRDLIKERNAGVSPQEEMEVMEALGYHATDDEIRTFVEYEWSMDVDVLQNYAAFRASLPPSWRSA